MNEIHVHRFRWDPDGCYKTFGNRTNLERHKTTHDDTTPMQDVFQCSNLWRKTPETRFTRKDNFERHGKCCVAF
ncbi:hypothetical protein BKA63DRAFT_525401 [Paraphoma chrysanthemicola]|nr:hypothetical protein BKA63DRAFT_525401 [Paraphoma chrysanthemicola]